MTNAVTLASLANSGYLRNRIINGAMQIDQRNAGASVSVLSTGNQFFSVDRFYCQAQGGGVYSIQQSTTAPSGFLNSIIATVTTPDSSVTGTDFYVIKQRIEGFNVADLGWGTASAQTVTLSFWVRSSITGTYTGSFLNSAENRSYPFTYTINSANTFEYKTITVPGDTTGTWVTNNGNGMAVGFCLGVGSTYQGTANAWAGARAEGGTSQTQWISTNGATFYITGVQLEVGTQATPFEWRPYGTELNLCQRYCFVGLSDVFTNGVGNPTYIWAHIAFKQTMRTAPSVSVSGTVQFSDDVAADYQAASPSIGGYNLVADGGRVRIDGFSGLTQYRSYNGISSIYLGKFTFSAEL